MVFELFGKYCIHFERKNQRFESRLGSGEWFLRFLENIAFISEGKNDGLRAVRDGVLGFCFSATRGTGSSSGWRDGVLGFCFSATRGTGSCAAASYNIINYESLWCHFIGENTV